MEAKDTVMSPEELGGIVLATMAEGGCIPHEIVAHSTRDLLIARAQAEISFKAGEEQGIKTALKAYESTCESLIVEARKAGIREVVEYAEKYVYYVDKAGYVALRPDASKNWQAKLKEWEIKED